MWNILRKKCASGQSHTHSVTHACIVDLWLLWRLIVVVMPTMLALTSPKSVITTIFCAARDDKTGIMPTLGFQRREFVTSSCGNIFSFVIWGYPNWLLNVSAPYASIYEHPRFYIIGLTIYIIINQYSVGHMMSKKAVNSRYFFTPMHWTKFYTTKTFVYIMKTRHTWPIRRYNWLNIRVICIPSATLCMGCII